MYSQNRCKTKKTSSGLEMLNVIGFKCLTLKSLRLICSLTAFIIHFWIFFNCCYCRIWSYYKLITITDEERNLFCLFFLIFINPPLCLLCPDGISPSQRCCKSLLDVTLDKHPASLEHHCFQSVELQMEICLPAQPRWILHKASALLSQQRCG